MCSIITLCLLTGVSTLTSSIQGIAITSRAQWQARSPKGETKISAKNLPVPFVVMHHCTGSNNTHCMEAQCAAAVRRYQAFHMDKKDRKDISYNFMIAPTGEIFEGRGWGVKGSHSVPYNNRSTGICIIGNYTYEIPSDKALQSVKDLIQFGIDSNHIQSNYTLIGHRQSMPTPCPGDKLFDIIKTWQHWRNV